MKRYQRYKEVMTVVDPKSDVNAKIINDIFEEFMKINSDKDNAKWAKKVRTIKLGPLKQYNILDVIDNFGQGSANDIVKKDFKNSLHLALINRI